MHGTELESDFYKATTLPNTKPLAPSQVAQPATPNSAPVAAAHTQPSPPLAHCPAQGLQSQGQTVPPAPSSPFSLQHSWVVQTPGNATR